jgi:2-polyprenyl-6-methoxyphenol hydroxylase-like FAD-dependent oxidoreductase
MPCPRRRFAWGARLVGFEQVRGGVVAHFADGREARGGVLVGADGLHSVVRDQLLGRKPPRYAGYVAWRGTARFDHAALASGTFIETWGCGVRFGLVPVGRGFVYWYATKSTARDGSDVRGQLKSALLRLFHGWHAPIEDVIDATDEAAILRNDICDRPPARRWGGGRVTLLGDAAHPTTPDLGQGACLAIEDAVALAATLSKRRSLVAALRSYETRRIWPTARITVLSRCVGSVGQCEHRIACRSRNALIQVISRVHQWTQLRSH